MTAEEVWLHEWQTPTGRALVVKPKTGVKAKYAHLYVYVLSECCRYDIDVISMTDDAFCLNCKEKLPGKYRLSSAFPVAAFKMARRSDYWWDWGKQWFDWDEFNFEVS